jgi:hypothetical protein
MVMVICRTRLMLLAVVSVMWWLRLWDQTAQAQVKLEYKFPEGKTRTYKTTSRVRQNLGFGGTNVNSSKRETTVWSHSIGKRRDDLTLPIEEKVQSLRVEYSLPPPPGTTLILDSSQPGKPIDDDRLAFLGDVFKARSALVYRIVLDGKNKLKGIEGTEKPREKAMKLGDPIAREEIGNELNLDKLKTQFEQMIFALPAAAIRPGEPWERTESLAVEGRALTVRKKYEYLGTEKRDDKALDKIGSKVIEVKFEQGPDAKSPLKVQKSDLKVDSSAGTLLFDREQGQMVSTSERHRFKGSATFSGAGLDQSVQLELTVDIDSQLQRPAQ